MGNPKGILKVLREIRFMDTYKYVCTYYKLRVRGDNYCNKIIEAGLRELVRKCLEFIEKGALLQTNDCNIGDHIYHIIINHNPNLYPYIVG